MSEQFKNQSVIDDIRKWKDFSKNRFFFFLWLKRIRFLPGKAGDGQRFLVWWLADGVECSVNRRAVVWLILASFLIPASCCL